MSKYLYVAVTNDEYEIPIAIEDNCIDLARDMHTSASVIRSNICRTKKGLIKERASFLVRKVSKDDI